MLHWPLCLPLHYHAELGVLTNKPLKAPRTINSPLRAAFAPVTIDNKLTLPPLDKDMNHLLHFVPSPPPELCLSSASPKHALRRECQTTSATLLTRSLSMPMSQVDLMPLRPRAHSIPLIEDHPCQAHTTDFLEAGVRTCFAGKRYNKPSAQSSISADMIISDAIDTTRSSTPDLELPLRSSSPETAFAPSSDVFEPADVVQVEEYDAASDDPQMVRVWHVTADFQGGKSALSSSPDFDHNGSALPSTATKLGKRRREEVHQAASRELMSQSQSRSNKIIRILRKPFVSPVRPRPPMDDTAKIEKVPAVPSRSETAMEDAQPSTDATPTNPAVARPFTTRRLAMPFKAPRSAVSAPPTSNLRSLEDRARLLRQAVRFRTQPEEDEHVEELVRKWRAAGREIVERLFGCVPGPENAGSIVGWQGYNPLPLDRPGDIFTVKTVTDETPEQADVKMEDVESPRWSFGTMMSQMGVDPTLLGWDEDEEDWCD